MARRESVLLLCLLALAAAAPDYSQEDAYAAAEEAEEAEAWGAQREQERGGEEARPWSDDAAAAYDEQDADDAPQEEYNLRANSEQQTQQVQDPQLVQSTDEGTLGRLRDQQEQRTGQLQQEQQTGYLQQDQQTGRLEDQQSWQQSSQITRDQQTGRLEDRPQPGERPAPGDRPQISPPTKPLADGEFGFSNRPSQPVSPQYPPSRPPIRQPPSGYSKVQSFGFFKVFETALTWPEALVTCWQDGAQLALPNSIAEANAVGELYGRVKNKVKKSQDKDLFFLGASDLAKEGDFVTVWGTKFNAGQWHRWQKGEPNNHKKIEHCVLSNDKGFYWDGNCQARYAFICQFKDPCQSSPRFDNIEQFSNQQQQQQQQSQSRY